MSFINIFYIYSKTYKKSSFFIKIILYNQYLNLNKKTQIISPTLLGECIYEVVGASVFSLLNPKLTASWEKGLTQVADGFITTDEYMKKLEDFIARHTTNVKDHSYGAALQQRFKELEKVYGGKGGKK